MAASSCAVGQGKNGMEGSRKVTLVSCVSDVQGVKSIAQDVRRNKKAELKQLQEEV